MLFAVKASLFVGCGGAEVRPGDEAEEKAPSETVVLDTEIMIPRGDDVVAIKPAALFEQASAELDAKKYEACAENFDILWRAIEAPEIQVPSLYNAGLCYERQQKWQPAAERYLKLVEVDGDSRDGLDAYFRLAEVDANTGTWARVVSHMEQVLERDDLRHLDEMEAMYRLGMGYVAQRELTKAEQTFKKGMRKNRYAERAKLPNRNYFVSGFVYGRALVFHLTFGEIQFRLPVEQMERDMETKIELGRQAYDLYVRTIRYKHPYWAILSGYMVGKLFEDFYYAVLSAEIPHDLSDEEMRTYMLDLREELRPLLEEALDKYEQTSATSERIGIENDWVEETEKRMNRLRTYLDDEELLRAEEDAIIAWNKQLQELEAAREEAPEEDEALVTVPPRPPMPVPKGAVPE